MTETLIQLLTRLRGYAPVEVVVELVIIGLVVYGVLRFLRGTRGAGIIKGLALLLLASTVVVRMLSQGGQAFQRLEYLYNGTLGFLAIALVVIFQPELRRALTRLGEAAALRSTPSEMQEVIDAIVEACRYHAKNKFGALIAIQRNVGLGGLVEGGTRMNADVSVRLLQSIFWPNNPLHDLGVIINGNRVVAANVQFPLAEHAVAVAHLGSRHRAALGITQESDCIAVVVSEERGSISVTERGQMYFNVSPEHLARFLVDRLVRTIESNEWASGDAIVRVDQPADRTRTGGSTTIMSPAGAGPAGPRGPSADGRAKPGGAPASAAASSRPTTSAAAAGSSPSRPRSASPTPAASSSAASSTSTAGANGPRANGGPSTVDGATSGNRDGTATLNVGDESPADSAAALAAAAAARPNPPSTTAVGSGPPRSAPGA